MTDLLFRYAVSDDVPALHRLIESAYRGEASRAGWTTEADLLDGQRTDPEDLAEVLADPEQALLTAWRDGVLLGSVLIARRAPGVGYFGMLSVVPTLQGGGVGRRLVEAAHAELQARFDATRVRISVFPQRDTLIAWYERLGYRATGETLPFPYGNPRFGLPRRDDLHFIVMERSLEPGLTRVVGLPIRTERLTLRPARADDLAGMHAVLSDPRATRWWSTPPHDGLQQTADWLQGMIDGGGSGLDRVIERDGVVIGKAGFWRAPDLGYILHPDHWGQGLAGEAVEAMLDRFFATTGHAIATADVDPDNAASIRLLERLGFVKTGFAERTWNVGGEWKNSLYYGLSRADRVSRRRP